MADSQSAFEDAPGLPEDVADAWAAVILDIDEKDKASGELPDDDDDQPRQGNDS
jgi:hypothetical protein